MVTRAPPPPPQLPDVPTTFKEPAVASYFRRLRDAISTELLSRPRKTEPTANLLLISPNGNVYEVVVSNGGVLSTNLLPS